DQQPELLFRLRGVDEADLITAASRAMPIVTAMPAGGKVLEDEDLAVPPERPEIAVPAPVAAKPARTTGSRRKTAKAETDATARYELTPDGFVKWWK
ncbi:MAG: hypothetical protein RLZZ501_1603, partial [Pseudomonadota bacterium]